MNYQSTLSLLKSATVMKKCEGEKKANMYFNSQTSKNKLSTETTEVVVPLRKER